MAYKYIIRDCPELKDAVVDLFTENEAIKRLNTTSYHDSFDSVKQNPTDPRIRSSSYERPNRDDCLYIQGFVGSVTEDRIRNELFEDFGDISGFWLSRLKKHCFVYVNCYLS